ncbi:MAG: potassium transporter TrkG, partial [Bacteroidales bacterium]
MSMQTTIWYRYLKWIKKIPLLISSLALFILIYEFGFERSLIDSRIVSQFYILTIVIGIIFILGRYIKKKSRPRLRVLVIDIILVGFLIFQVLNSLNILENYPYLFRYQGVFTFFAIFIVFIRELFVISFNLKQFTVNPAQLFITSFFSLIIFGSLLLLLPNATYEGIEVIDALFTSTSAVCVTGLIVVDTGSYFTLFGQFIIIFLVQAGGLGIMTFASYFGYFFKGGASYETQLLLYDFTSTEKLGDVLKTLKRIILITFILELIGAILIFQSISKIEILSFSERLFFSFFHSVSGFCNAGFSTLENSFFELPFRFNYSLHLIIAVLIILGGIGFPIVFNLLKYLKIKSINFIKYLFQQKEYVHSPWIINLNTRIVLATTFVLILFGFVMFFILEYDNTLAEHSMYGKIVASFFGSVTTRTAGFNTVDTSMLNIPIVMVILFLMWIGASPGSTGGGIKTSTFAIAVFNFISLAKGRQRIEILQREISQVSVNRASAIMILSILVIFISSFGINVFDSDKGLLSIFFEVVSAHSTVGLSRGITASLSNPGKFILILTMFVG